MSLDSKTNPQPTAATDIEAVSRQLVALRQDMSRLTETVSAIAGRRSSHMAADIAEGFDEAKHYAESKGRFPLKKPTVLTSLSMAGVRRSD